MFERVIPGKGRIGRRIVLMVDDGATEVTSSQRVSTTFIPGQTTALEIGGTGRLVVGKLAPPPGHVGPVLWNFALIIVESDPYITATVDRDGSFHIDDLPPGEYVLGVRFSKAAPGVLSSHRFSVPPILEGRLGESVDLGTLTLTTQ